MDEIMNLIESVSEGFPTYSDRGASTSLRSTICPGSQTLSCSVCMEDSEFINALS